MLSSQSRVRPAARLLPLLAALPAVQSSGIAQALPRVGIVLEKSDSLYTVMTSNKASLGEGPMGRNIRYAFQVPLRFSSCQL